MPRILPILFALFAASAASAAADIRTIDIYDHWGAFENSEQDSCYAMSLPERRGTGTNPAAKAEDGAYLAIVTAKGGEAQFYARLGKARLQGAGATVSVGGRRFTLNGKGRDLHARDVRMDRALIAAIRSARSLSIESVNSDGRAVVYGYDLVGAASAIDAARLACRF